MSKKLKSVAISEEYYNRLKESCQEICKFSGEFYSINIVLSNLIKYFSTMNEDKIKYDIAKQRSNITLSDEELEECVKSFNENKNNLKLGE
jgi:hypothetical protein